MRKLKVMIVLELMAVLTGFMSCKKDEPVQPHEASVQLALEDVSCTEAWLKVSLTDGAEPRTVALQQDGQRVLTVHMGNTDSLCVIEGLLPRHTYSFVAQRLRDSTVIDASSAVQATMMDTTSHNFHFQIDTLGVTSSTLYDVAIINDTLAYAVGELYLRDSTGQVDPIAYSIAIWDGSTWQMRRLFYDGNNLTAPIRGVYAFGAMDVWLAAGSVFHWNGVGLQAELSFSRLTLPSPDGTVEKLWGSPDRRLFCVGNAGTIVEYDGSWQRVESRTCIASTEKGHFG